jgi:hypothetical protein
MPEGLVFSGSLPEVGRVEIRLTPGERCCLVCMERDTGGLVCRLLSGLAVVEGGKLTLDGAPYPTPDGESVAPVGYLPSPAPPLIRPSRLPDTITAALGVVRLLDREGPFSPGENQLLHLGALLVRGHVHLALDRPLDPLGREDAGRVLELLAEYPGGVLITAATAPPGWRALTPGGKACPGGSDTGC